MKSDKEGIKSVFNSLLGLAHGRRPKKKLHEFNNDLINEYRLRIFKHYVYLCKVQMCFDI